MLAPLLLRMARERPDRAILRSFEPLLFERGGEAKKHETWNHKKLTGLVEELLDAEDAAELEATGVVRRDYSSEAGEFEIKITSTADLKNGDVFFVVIEPKFYEHIAPERVFPAGEKTNFWKKLKSMWQN